ncbi:hypothetical protein [Lutispora saccharofermentans]|uniref:Uncharacterized protein n=1 Tax=Lutispora saccharofermentans TaxID=3024236 RepID=A0ABT1NJU6_9FIRM|nr:hypothetical protein [Lutispora saccharofermentans]MCQ1531548.1 hypothetical protein [Lutispora saccharofermentans]
MSGDIRYDAEVIKNERFIGCNKLNCKRLVYNKRLSGKFRLYLSDKGAYKKAFELIAKKRFTHH